jgi:hypothetical protein
MIQKNQFRGESDRLLETRSLPSNISYNCMDLWSFCENDFLPVLQRSHIFFGNMKCILYSRRPKFGLFFRFFKDRKLRSQAIGLRETDINLLKGN